MGASIRPIGLSDAQPLEEPEREYCEPAVITMSYVSGLMKATIRDGALQLTFFLDQDGASGGIESVINVQAPCRRALGLMRAGRSMTRWRRSCAAWTGDAPRR
jgi:hypothetical protein